MLDALATLVDHSLLQSTEDPSGEPRFGMRETIRAHAMERLEMSGEAEAMRRRHAQTFLALAEEVEPYLASAHRLPWLRRLDMEFSNIRAALQWCSSAEGDVEVGQRLVGSLSWFWYLRGHLQEGRLWSERMLSRAPSDSTSPGHARALWARGGIVLMMQGDPTTAHAALEESVRLFAAQSDLPRQTLGLALLGLATTSLRDPVVARGLYREAAQLAREIDDAWLEAFALVNDGAATEMLADQAAADALYRRSLALFDALSDAWGRGLALRGIGGLASARGDYATARAVYAESVALFRETADARGLAQALLGLGKAALWDGEVSEAEATFRDALGRWQVLGISVGIVRSVAGLAGVAAAHGQFERAVQLYAAATTQAHAVGAHYALADEEERSRTVAKIRERLDPERFAAAWAVGELMTLSQAAAAALSEAER